MVPPGLLDGKGSFHWIKWHVYICRSCWADRWSQGGFPLPFTNGVFKSQEPLQEPGREGTCQGARGTCQGHMSSALGQEC